MCSAAAAGEGRIEEYDSGDEIVLLHHITAQRDEHRSWKLEPSDDAVMFDEFSTRKSPAVGEKRKHSSPGPEPDPKRAVRDSICILSAV